MAHIFALNRSDGGVPKLPVAEAAVSREGMAGDRQSDLKHHGGPDRALCLLALEVILALQVEGHPIYPGSTGENVTISGLDWATLAPGRRVSLGEVEIEITAYAAPCRTITTSFAGGGFGRLSQKKNPGQSRLYARVLQPGTLRVGDPVEPLDRAS